MVSVYYTVCDLILQVVVGIISIVICIFCLFVNVTLFAFVASFIVIMYEC